MYSFSITSRYQQLESEEGLYFSEAKMLYCDLIELRNAQRNKLLELKQNNENKDDIQQIQIEMNKYNQMLVNLETPLLKYWLKHIPPARIEINRQ
ncbi:hypothetical protein [Dehalobacter sp. TBBPA1]|uniref:hypothetical protein n=1 Tax=Dehalobacter sp. TBBPA1 TaxID=3235037 RepID=UPI0034A4E713